MGGILGGGAKAPAAPDTSYLDQQRAAADAQKAKLARQNASRLRNGRRGGGRKSLLLFSTLRGVDAKNRSMSKTLG